MRAVKYLYIFTFLQQLLPIVNCCYASERERKKNYLTERIVFGLKDGVENAFNIGLFTVKTQRNNKKKLLLATHKIVFFCMWVAFIGIHRERRIEQ